MRSILVNCLGFLGLAVLAGCAPEPSGDLEPRTLAKGEVVSMRALMARNDGRYLCVNYRASSESCKSLSRISVSGTRVVSRIFGLFPLPGREPERFEIINRLTIEGNRLCAAPNSYELARESAASPGGRAAANLSNLFINNHGGICATYYAAANGAGGYVGQTRGRDGRPVAPGGDFTVHFFDTPKAVRVPTLR